MITKAIAVLAAVLLPLSLSLWYKSHARPGQHRYDLTLSKSAWVYLGKGVCAINVLSMPHKVASRTEFHASLNLRILGKKGRWSFNSTRDGLYRYTWLVFPLWMPSAILAGVCAGMLLCGPYRVWRRQRRGQCITCGYNLTGSATGRCPECGSARAKRPLRRQRWNHVRVAAQARNSIR